MNDRLGPIWTPDPVVKGHPHNEGLAAWWLGLPHLSGGAKRYDVMSGVPISLSGGYSWAAQPNGFPATAFNGSTGYGVAAGIPGVAGASAITLAFSLFKSSFNNSDSILAESSTNYNLNAGTFVFNPDSGSPFPGQFQASFRGASVTVTAAGFARPTAGAWHFYVITYTFGNLDTVTADVDGVPQSVGYRGRQNNAGSTFGNYPLYFGARAGSAIFCPATLGEFAVYSGALTPAVRSGLYDDWARGHPDTLRRLTLARMVVFGSAYRGGAALLAAC